jgi:RHS repeat-associated protein
LGRRVEQSSAAGTTRYVSLGANVVAEYDATNTLRASYVTTLGTGDLPGVPLEVSVGSSTSYPLLDGVGSVTALSDSAGSIGSTFSYTAYGTPVGTSAGTYAYGTYGYDSATGLYYARARYYDATTGRFLSEDPKGLYASPSDSLIASAPSGATCATGACSGSFSAPTFPGASIDSLVSGVLPGSGLSPYGYGSQNPINLTDPTGRFALDEYSERTSSNQAANKVARDAGKAAARALGCSFTKAMRQALHRRISGQGLSGFSEILEAALELFANCKGE